MDLEFGRMRVDPYVDQLIKRVKPFGAVESQLKLLSTYHNHFNFPALEDANTVLPIPEVAVWEIEDTRSNNPLLELPRLYRHHRINNYFHISLDEFLEYPEYFCKDLCDLADEFMTQEIRERDRAAKEAELQAKAEAKVQSRGTSNNSKISAATQQRLDMMGLSAV